MSGRYVSTENAYVKSDIVDDQPRHRRPGGQRRGRGEPAGQARRRAVPDRPRAVPDRARPWPRPASSRCATTSRRRAPSFARSRPRSTRPRSGSSFFEQQAERQRELEERGIAAQVAPRGGRDGARRRAASGSPRCARSCAPCWRELGGDPASAVELHPAFMRGRGRARHGRAAISTTPWSARRSTASSAGCACSPASGSRRAMPRSASSTRTSTWIEANLKETQLDARRGRAAGRDRGRRLSGPAAGRARSPASARRPAPSSR